MSLLHSGNMVPEITMEEHNGLINAKKVDIVQSVSIPSTNTVLEVPFSTATNAAVGSTDVSSYRGVGVQLTTRGTNATITFQGSNDNTNWYSVALTISTSVTTAPVVSVTAAGAYYGPLHFKYFRLNVTGQTGGTTDGRILFSSIYSDSNPITSTAVTIAAAATSIGKAEDAAAASANVGVPPLAVRADALPANAGTSADGDYAFVFTDNTGRVYTNAKVTETVNSSVTVLNSQATVNIGNILNSFTTILNSQATVNVANSQTTVSVYGSYDKLQQDRATWAINTIDYAHHEVHAGSHYYVKDWIDIGSSATVSFLFKTPDTAKWAHAQWDLASEAEATFTLYEDAVIAATGSAVTIYNNNRNSASAPGVLAYSTPSITSLGNKIYSAKLGSGRAVGGGVGREHEMIGKQNTNYLFVLSNDDGTATRWLGYDFFWYEHLDKA